jgi:galactokinase/mevalonate kinase-like predicted kinase
MASRANYEQRANHCYQLAAPARINILGNPGDANEGAYATISAAVEPFAGARIEPDGGWWLESLPIPPAGWRWAADDCPGEAGAAVEQVRFTPADLPLRFNGQLGLMKSALNRLYGFSAELRDKLPRQGMHIQAWSCVPRQAGLGGSSLYVLLTLAALRQFYDLDRRVHNDYILAELTQNAEEQELGIACGFADRYVPLFGGLAYLDFRGKLVHQPIRQEPLVTYERLENYAADLPLVAITTGVQHDSGDVHGRMRPRFVREHLKWQRNGGSRPEIVRLMQSAYECAWRGKIALLEGDLETFGQLMGDNHRLVDEMMSLCGFEDGAGWANNLCIRAALEAGALGAKLTGAGGGGSVFALARPGQEESLAEALRQAARQAGLDQAVVFTPRICRQGLVVEAV